LRTTAVTLRKQSIIEARREQAFPILEHAEIERMRRFGTLRSYKPGEILAQAGQGH
jgi:thioredoxin reductase (NADPH)